MSKIDLSILIPARNEMFLARTVEDLLQNMRGNTEIIVVLDGAPADPPLPWDKRVHVITHAVAIGQRAATNEAARLARGKYLMKVDAHCAFDDGFDVKMLEAIAGHDDWTMVPLMRNLHAFDWVCPDGHRRYQGPSGPCDECKKPTEREMRWRPRRGTRNASYLFDCEPHFQYFKEFSSRPEGQGDITPTMSLQGSCFMCTKERYFTLNLSDESWGSWGSQGIEVACKTWLSGGSVMVNHKTWYAHLFRTQGEDFGFPYEHVFHKDHKKIARELFYDNRWEHQKRPLSWLLEKFWPVPGWDELQLAQLKAWPLQPGAPRPRKTTKGIVYYTHNQRTPEMFEMCQRQILRGMKEKHIVSASRLPITFGKLNIVHEAKSDIPYLDMFEKILLALEAQDADVIFFCEDDVMYHPSHFDFIPPRRDAFYYNVNVWKLRYADGFCLKVDDCKQLSGLCAYRDTLIDHFRERVRRVRAEGFTRKNGFEPGTRSIKSGGYCDREALPYFSRGPNIDIRHDANSTANRWRKDQFRNQKYTIGWTESHLSNIPGWEDLDRLLYHRGDEKGPESQPAAQEKILG